MDRAWLGAYVAWAAAVLVVLTVITAAVGLAVRAWAPAFDLQTVQTIAAQRSATLTWLAFGVTALGSLAVVAAMAAVVVAWRLWRKDLHDGVVLAICVVGAAVLPSVAKLVVGRPRPPVEHLVQVTSFSFPSEHAVQAAGIYLAIALVVGRSWPTTWQSLTIAGAILLALLVAASRVYLGVHYPTDVAGGLLVGWCWGWLVGNRGPSRRLKNR